MSYNIRVYDDLELVGQYQNSGESVVSKVTQTNDGIYKYVLPKTIKRVTVHAEEEGPYYVQLLEFAGEFSQSGPGGTIGSYVADTFLIGSEVVSIDDRDNIVDGLEDFEKISYITGSAGTSIVVGDLNGYDFFLHYNWKATKLFASIPLVSSGNANETQMEIWFKISGLQGSDGLANKKVTLYFHEE